jgi:hypothetical protein
MPDTEAYRAADQNGDGMICGIALSTAEDIGEDAIDEIEDLVPDPLSAGQANALITKIANAVAKAAVGQTQAAINQMQAFLNHLSQMIGDETLSAEEAAPFVEQAEFLIEIWTESL